MSTPIPPPPPPPGVISSDNVISADIPIPSGIPGAPAFPGFGFAPVATKTKPNKKPKVPMKELNWQKLNENSIKDTIWEKIDDTKLKFNPDEFCEIFAKDEPNSPPKNAVKKSVFLGPDRQANIDIVLGKIKLKPIDISDAILIYDEEILTEHICDLLTPIFPKYNEYDEITKKKQKI